MRCTKCQQAYARFQVTESNDLGRHSYRACRGCLLDRALVWERFKVSADVRWIKEEKSSDDGYKDDPWLPHDRSLAL